jgi:hypothetical protein
MSPSRANLGETFERIRVQLQLNSDEWTDTLAMQPSAYRTAIDSGVGLTETHVENLADALDLDPEAILNATLDFQALEAHRKGNVDYIPTRYSQVAFSKRRTSNYILEFVEREYGWRKKLEILRKLQVTESALQNTEGWINIRFLQDVCHSIVDLTGNPNILQHVGEYSYVANRFSPIGKIYRSLSGPKELFEATFPELAGKYYDKNTHYRLLKLTDTDSILEATANPEVAEGLKTKRVGSPGVCAQKIGVLASFMGYLNLPFAKVEHPSCIHRGDQRCLFSVDFSDAAYASKSAKRPS